MFCDNFAPNYPENEYANEFMMYSLVYSINVNLLYSDTHIGLLKQQQFLCSYQ